jgi:hypothetical protein
MIIGGYCAAASMTCQPVTVARLHHGPYLHKYVPSLPGADLSTIHTNVMTNNTGLDGVR